MADQVDKFYANWHDKLVPSRGGITGQCVSLSQKYLEEQFGAGGTPVFPVDYAKDMFGVRSDLGTWVRNTPDGIPPRGSIVTLDGRYGNGAGHTGVTVWSDQNSLDLLEENDPYGSGAHVKKYNYNGVIGWLIPNGLGQAPQQGGEIMTFTNPVNGDTRDAQGWYNAYAERDKQTHDLLDWQAGANQHINDLQAQVNNLTKVTQDSQKLITTLQDQLKAAGADKDSLNKKIDELNKKIENATTNQVSLDGYSLGELLSAAFSKLFKVK